MGDELLVYVGGQTEPAENEWQAYARLAAELAERVKARATQLRFCVFVDDGAPNAKQRALLADAVRGVSCRVAVLTTSVLARHVITVFGWLGADIQGFAPSGLPDAARYLELSTAQLQAAIDAASGMAASLGGVQAVAAAMPDQPWLETE